MTFGKLTKEARRKTLDAMKRREIAESVIAATLWFGVANAEAGFVADANIDDSGTITVSFQNDTEQVIKLSNIRIEAPGHPRLLRHVPAPSLHAVAV